MGAYPGYKFHMFVWKLQQWPLEIRYMGAYPGVGACLGHYGKWILMNRVWAVHACTSTLMTIKKKGGREEGRVREGRERLRGSKWGRQGERERGRERERERTNLNAVAYDLLDYYWKTTSYHTVSHADAFRQLWFNDTYENTIGIVLYPPVNHDSYT